MDVSMTRVDLLVLRNYMGCWIGGSCKNLGIRSICWESEEAVKKKNEYIIKLDWGRGSNR